MPRCPVCDSPGAYIGFNTIECRNPQCEHFVYEQAATCPCCGRTDHIPETAADYDPDGIMLNDPLGMPGSSSGKNAGSDDPTMLA
jgi:hypothetical protein